MIVGDRSRRERHWFPFTPQTYALLQRVVAFRHRKGSIFTRLRNLLFPALLMMLLLSAGPSRAASISWRDGGHLASSDKNSSCVRIRANIGKFFSKVKRCSSSESVAAQSESATMLKPFS